MSKATDDELVFRGSIAALESAISFGQSGGARVRIDIPQIHRIAAAALVEVQGCELEFRVKVVKQYEQNNKGPDRDGGEVRKNFAF